MTDGSLDVHTFVILRQWPRSLSPFRMKLHRRAERFARRHKRTRSGLYAEALGEFLSRRSDEEVTAAINRALEAIPMAEQERDASAGTQRAARAWAKDAEWND